MRGPCVSSAETTKDGGGKAESSINNSGSHSQQADTAQQQGTSRSAGMQRADAPVIARAKSVAERKG